MKFTHIDKNQKASMVDVSNKNATERIAVAECYIILGTQVIRALDNSNWTCKKGPIIDTAIIAGTMAAKKTSDLIPFCHPLKIQSINIEIISMDKNCLRVTAIVKAHDQTGVEMEALTAASVAALTIYDMCKSASKKITIERTRLIKKSGGTSDYSFENM